MKVLSRTEEMILLAVHALAPNAYGLAIGQHLEKITGKHWSVGAIYIPLERLGKRGLLTSHEGEPTPERGGRSKRFYRLSPKGLEVLLEAKRTYEALLAALPKKGLA
ncbi:MAG: PadR family transcriptional regulator [Anaerolineales bacterium]